MAFFAVFYLINTGVKVYAETGVKVYTDTSVKAYADTGVKRYADTGMRHWLFEFTNGEGSVNFFSLFDHDIKK